MVLHHQQGFSAPGGTSCERERGEGEAGEEGEAQASAWIQQLTLMSGSVSLNRRRCSDWNATEWTLTHRMAA